MNENGVRVRAGILGVAAIKLPPHPAHSGCYDVALVKLTARRSLNYPSCFDTEDAGKLHRGNRRMPLTGKQFRAVETKCLDSNQDLAIPRLGNRTALDFENLRPPGFMDYSGFHGIHSPHLSYCCGGLVVEKM